MNPAAAGPVHSQYSGDPDFRDLLQEFAAAMPVRRDGLLDAHRSGAYDLLRMRAHQLKGAGGGFGFPRLSELALELEKACQSHEPAKIAEALEQVVGYLNRITV
jgi:HPt (histidine-containing phosphotransfer) domain-containing protein